MTQNGQSGAFYHFTPQHAKIPKISKNTQRIDLLDTNTPNIHMPQTEIYTMHNDEKYALDSRPLNNS